MSNTYVRIENWSIVTNPDPYMAPEQKSQWLQGDVYGHPLHPDGKSVVTSRMVSVEGRIVKTKSGTLYELGNPDKNYAKYCESIGKPIDESQPIKMLR